VAGRTDAGVHATGQVAHVDLPADAVAAAADLLRRLNGVLPPDVRIRGALRAPAGFDARFSALSRRYVYRLTDRIPDPLRRGDTLAYQRPLDARLMAAAALGLIGEHDFAGFCRRRPGGTTVRRLLVLDVVPVVHGVVEVRVEADAFCHSMVRALVGALLAVGDGRQPIEWPAAVLAARRRDPALTVAPAHGLTLVRVRYPRPTELAARAEQTRRWRDLPAESGGL